jgi:multidrug efflux system membrane fusion protein
MTSRSNQRGRLPGGSWGIVGLIAAALVLWMLTGAFSSKKPEAAEVVAANKAAEKFHVMVRDQVASSIRREVVINGNTMPDQIVNLSAQVEGQVVAIGARKGTRVKKGDLIAKLDSRDLEQHRAREAATLKQRELEYQGAQKLAASHYITPTELAAKLAALESARSELKDAEFQITHLQIRAPVAGIVEDQQVEVGDYARVGSPIARLIVNDPLRLSGGVNEQDVRQIRVGDAATAELTGGEQLQGSVRFVSAMADEKTRTFTVEVAVANPQGKIPAGLSARVLIPVDEVSAHKIPASLLSLADNGDVGVKFVGDDDRVVFTRAHIVRSDGDAVWVSGLPERIRLITRGQGFVNAGEPVVVETEGSLQKTEQAAGTAS